MSGGILGFTGLLVTLISSGTLMKAINFFEGFVVGVLCSILLVVFVFLYLTKPKDKGESEETVASKE